MTDRQAAADSVVRLLTLAERRGVISGAEHRYARDVIEALSVRLAQAERLAMHEEAARNSLDDARGYIEELKVRLREYEEALQKIADNQDAVVLNMDGKEIEPWQNKRGDWLGSPRLIARAVLAASGGREAPDTKEPGG